MYQFFELLTEIFEQYLKEGDKEKTLGKLERFKEVLEDNKKEFIVKTSQFRQETEEHIEKMNEFRQETEEHV